MAIGNPNIEYESPGAGASNTDRRDYMLGVQPGCVQGLRVLGAGGAATGGAGTFIQTFTMEGPFSAVRFQYANGTTTTNTLTLAKCGAAASVTTDGSGVTPVNVTFDTSATGKASDTYTGIAGSATTFAVPARIGAGSGANAVQGTAWSDWVPLDSVPCTDPGGGNFAVVTHRVYTAAAVNVPNTSTSATNWGNYNANSRRPVYGAFNGGDQVTAWPNTATSTGWQWMPVVQVQALLYKLCTNHAVFGDSISKGQGSFDISNGLWGWVQRGVQGLTDAGYGTHSMVNYGTAGQGKAATWANFLNAIDQGAVHTATMFPWSPTDGITAGATPWALNTFKYQVYAFIAACRRSGVRPILATQPPCSVITDVPGDLVRKAMNDEVRAVCANSGRSAILCDFDAAVTNTASPARFLPLLSTDNIHPSSAGHAVMARVWQEAAKLATFQA